MLRKTSCAVGGVALACAAAFSLSLAGQPSWPSHLDLRWLYSTSAKQDRLPVTRVLNDEVVVAFDRPTQSTTILTRHPILPRVESAIRAPRTTVRTIPVQPVREVPNEDVVKKQKLPEGCEPAFSPVTMPAFAHIGTRCDS